MAKGEPGDVCARTACDRKPAVGFNRSTGDWYCLSCSRRLNEENKEEAQRLWDGDLVIVGIVPFTKEPAFLDENGKFHCPCGASHSRGPLDPLSKVYRCLHCGKAYRVEGVVELR